MPKQITRIMKDLKEISTRLKIAKKNIKKVEEEIEGSNAASLGKALKISTELVAVDLQKAESMVA